VDLKLNPVLDQMAGQEAKVTFEELSESSGSEGRKDNEGKKVVFRKTLAGTWT
jgi:hypothetical protein